jgi:hypothetical protein
MEGGVGHKGSLLVGVSRGGHKAVWVALALSLALNTAEWTLTSVWPRLPQ